MQLGDCKRLGKIFSSQSSKLSTVICVQGVYQIAGVFEGDPTKFRDWNKSNEKYIL